MQEIDDQFFGVEGRSLFDVGNRRDLRFRRSGLVGDEGAISV
ncbi:hypothetical protein [Phormidium tenue]|nr:hypothetical protein [Phormidium tenue]